MKAYKAYEDPYEDYIEGYIEGYKIGKGACPVVLRCLVCLMAF
jgi:spore maturation protein SpmB